MSWQFMKANRIGMVRNIANRLIKSGVPRSKAFKKAWVIAKQRPTYYARNGYDLL